jgi:hypothetical protein
MMHPLPLSEKQKLFVAEYLVDLNATQVAIRAGYSAKTVASQTAIETCLHQFARLTDVLPAPCNIADEDCPGQGYLPASPSDNRCTFRRESIWSLGAG